MFIENKKECFQDTAKKLQVLGLSLVDDKIIPGNTFAIPLVEQSNTIDKKPFHFKYIWEININFVKQFFKFKELSKAGKFSQTRV